MAATGQPESRNNKRATTVNGNANEEVDESDREFVTSNDATIQNTQNFMNLVRTRNIYRSSGM